MSVSHSPYGFLLKPVCISVADSFASLFRHKRAFVLSDGIIGDNNKDKLWISCPMHKRNYDLKGSSAGKCSNDDTVSIATFPAESREDGMVYVKLPPVEELDGVLGTEKWRIKSEGEVDPFESLDKRFKPMKGRKGTTSSHLTNGLGSHGKAQQILVGGERGSSGMDW